MSTAEVASQADSNAQSAQDVQNMLAELKGSNQAATTNDSAVAENGEVAKASNEDVKEAKVNGSEKNGAKESESKKEDEAKEEKKEENAEDKSGERSRGQRPYRGGSRGRGGARGRGEYKNFKENIKSDLTTQAETDDPVQIRKQVKLSLAWIPVSAD
jgi:lupus La protein